MKRDIDRLKVGDAILSDLEICIVKQVSIRAFATIVDMRSTSTNTSRTLIAKHGTPIAIAIHYRSPADRARNDGVGLPEDDQQQQQECTP